jgi:hypothetical protein
MTPARGLYCLKTGPNGFFDIKHQKSSKAALGSRSKNILRRNIRPPFRASESEKRYSANVSIRSCLAKRIILKSTIFD